MLAATAGAVGAEPPTLTGPAPPALQPGTLTVVSPVNQAGVVHLRWDGPIASPMAQEIDRAFAAFQSSRQRFVLVLNSSGGSVAEGERTIAVLQRIRKTHRLDTVVERGARCGSMCVPLYLQGESRFGARASAWLFHEVTAPGTLHGRRRTSDGVYMRLIDKYMVPAGVSRQWIDRMLPLIAGHDWWQTGDNLINDGSNIITRPIENRTVRNLETVPRVSGPTSSPKSPTTAQVPAPVLPVSGAAKPESVPQSPTESSRQGDGKVGAVRRDASTTK